jgi:hypothetical protein
MQDGGIDKIYQMLTSTDKDMARLSIDLFKKSFSNPFDFLDLKLKILHHKWRSDEEKDIAMEHMAILQEWADKIGQEECEDIKERYDAEEAEREANNSYL